MVNQTGNFIAQLAELDKAQHDLLSKKNCWVWGTNLGKAYKVLKGTLSSPSDPAM